MPPVLQIQPKRAPSALALFLPPPLQPDIFGNGMLSSLFLSQQYPDPQEAFWMCQTWQIRMEPARQGTHTSPGTKAVHSASPSRFPAIRRDISDIRVLIQPGFRWIGSSPPAVQRLPSAVLTHKEQHLYQILIPGDSASLGLIPRVGRKCKSAECRGMLSQFGNSCSAPAQQPWHWSTHRGCRR